MNHAQGFPGHYNDIRFGITSKRGPCDNSDYQAQQNSHTEIHDLPSYSTPTDLTRGAGTACLRHAVPAAPTSAGCRSAPIVRLAGTIPFPRPSCRINSRHWARPQFHTVYV